MTRPTMQEIISIVADEFHVPVERIQTFFREKKLSQARAAVAVVAREYGHPYEAIGSRLNRSAGAMLEIATNGRRDMHDDPAFSAKVMDVRSSINVRRLERTLREVDAVYVEKLEANRAEILRLRKIGWSDKSLSRRFGIPVEVVRPVIGLSGTEWGRS